MAKLKIEITLGNDAMTTGDDLALALELIGYKLRSYGFVTPIEPQVILDSNGNRVGTWEVVS